MYQRYTQSDAENAYGDDLNDWPEEAAELIKQNGFFWEMTQNGDVTCQEEKPDDRDFFYDYLKHDLLFCLLIQNLKDINYDLKYHIGICGRQEEIKSLLEAAKVHMINKYLKKRKRSETNQKTGRYIKINSQKNWNLSYRKHISKA